MVLERNAYVSSRMVKSTWYFLARSNQGGKESLRRNVRFLIVENMSCRSLQNMLFEMFSYASESPPSQSMKPLNPEIPVPFCLSLLSLSGYGRPDLKHNILFIVYYHPIRQVTTLRMPLQDNGNEAAKPIELSAP